MGHNILRTQELSLPSRLLLVGVALGALVMGVRSCDDDNPPSARLLSHQELLEACAESTLEINFRAPTDDPNYSRQNFAVMTTDAYAGKKVSELAQRLYPDTDMNDAIRSIGAANPGLDVSSPNEVLPQGDVHIAISLFAQEVLPKGVSIREYAEEQGFDAASFACVNSRDPESRYGKDTAIVAPKQVATPASYEVTVVQAGDTYSGIAAKLGIPTERITPEALEGHNLVPPEELRPGDLIYSKGPEIVSPGEEVEEFVKKYREYALMVEDEFGIPWEAVLAQAMLETGFGESELAVKANNFHGLKYNDEDYVQGLSYSIESPEELTRDELEDKKREGLVVPGSEKLLENGNYWVLVLDEFQQFADPEEGFRGYGRHIKNRFDGEAYADALTQKDPYKYIEALVDDTGSRYATDSEYVRKVSRQIDQIQAIVADPAPVPPSSDLGALYDAYPANQRALESGNAAGDCAVGPEGIDFPQDTSRETDIAQLEIVQANIQSAVPTKSGFGDWKKRVIDDRTFIMGTYPREFNDLGEPGADPINPETVPYLVLHYTDWTQKANSHDSKKYGSSAKNSNSGLGANYYISNPGQANARTYYMSDSLLDNIRGYNGKSFGIEMAGCEQADLPKDVIEQAIYLSADFLIVNGYLDDVDSAAAVVGNVVKGHRELNPDGHSDWPAIASDMFREKLVGFLVDEMGYKR